MVATFNSAMKVNYGVLVLKAALPTYRAGLFVHLCTRFFLLNSQQIDCCNRLTVLSPETVCLKLTYNHLNTQTQAIPPEKYLKQIIVYDMFQNLNAGWNRSALCNLMSVYFTEILAFLHFRIYCMYICIYIYTAAR